MVDTIFAQASAPGRSGVTVIRVSGPDALTAAAALCGRLPAPRAATLRWLRDPATGDLLDQGLVITFPGPASFTGEDVAEVQVHGSAAVCRSILAALGRMDRLRIAEPGEFTRRALLAGRLDLSQVEGLGDLLAAETAAQQRQALASMRGAVSALAAGWRQRLIEALAFVEATIDFADEELPADVLDSVQRSLAELKRDMEREIRGSHIAERLRDGFEVGLVGRPNVGKSTLLNALAGRDAALTAETAGTTRDVIEVRMDLAGLPLTLLDMAGLREAEGDVEARGVARARERAAAADLRVFLVDDACDVPELGVPPQPGDVVALAKGDLRSDNCELSVSGLTGAGIDRLLEAIAGTLQERAAGARSVAHARQREGIERAARAVAAAQAELAAPEPRSELAAEELRTAVRALDFLVGRMDVEAVLDSIFASFCLGK
jgi:tRNA modification GTPase